VAKFHDCVSFSYLVKLSVLSTVKGKGDYGIFISKDMEERSCNLILDLISVVRSFLKFLSLSWSIHLPYLKAGHDLFLALNILLCDQLSSYSFHIFSLYSLNTAHVLASLIATQWQLLYLWLDYPEISV